MTSSVGNAVMDSSIKRFMFKFVRDTDSSPTVLLTHKSILTNLFKVLYNLNEDSYKRICVIFD